MIHKNSPQNGFTLIELVIVIVILGILAAVAVPKYIDLQRDARIAVIKGVSGAMYGASNLFQQKAYIKNIKDGLLEVGNDEIKIEGGYIAGHWNDSWRYALEIGKKISFTSVNDECTKHELCGVGFQRPSAISGLPILGNQRGVTVVWPNGYQISDECYAYYYNPNLPSNSAPEVPPSFGTVTTGC